VMFGEPTTHIKTYFLKATHIIEAITLIM